MKNKWLCFLFCIAVFCLCAIAAGAREFPAWKEGAQEVADGKGKDLLTDSALNYFERILRRFKRFSTDQKPKIAEYVLDSISVRDGSVKERDDKMLALLDAFSAEDLPLTGSVARKLMVLLAPGENDYVRQKAIKVLTRQCKLVMKKVEGQPGNFVLEITPK